MTETSESVSVSVYLPEKMIAYLDEVGKSRKRSRSFLIREWIEGEMDAEKEPGASQDRREPETGISGQARKDRAV